MNDFDEEPDDRDEDDYGEEDYSIDYVTLTRPSFEIVATENPLTSTGRISEYGAHIQRTMTHVKWVVYHNTAYGNTGNLSIWKMASFTDRYAASGHGLMSVSRMNGGCGSSEISPVHNVLGLHDDADALSLLHLLLTKVMVEPGPKCIVGVSTLPNIKLRYGMRRLHTWQSPHDNWEPRNLAMYAWDHKSIGEYFAAREAPMKFTPYLYVPVSWDWSITTANMDSVTFGRLNVLPKETMECTHQDIGNIPYLNNLTKEEPFG